MSDTSFPATSLFPIAIVAGDFRSTGGMDAANFHLADYAARHGHPVHLVAHHVEPSLIHRPGVLFERVARPLRSNLLGNPLLRRRGRQVARDIGRHGGRTIVNGGNCDWTDINWVHYVHAAYRAPSATNIAWRTKNAIAYRSFVKHERKSLQMARLIIANSNRTRDDLINRVGIDPRRIQTIYYGSDPAFQPVNAHQRAEAKIKLGWPSDRPIVAFIGALGDRRKGFDTVFQAWKRLCALPAWDADLAIVGIGAEMLIWKQRAADAGMASRFHFLGFRRDVPQILRASDALLSPTRYEAYGLGVQEALCAGLPAIVSADAGIAERYPAALSNLLLPDAEDATDLANRLQRWREQPIRSTQQFEEFSRSLRARSWDMMAAEILQKIMKDQEHE